MKPTRYELLIEHGAIVLRAYTFEAERGYFALEAVPYRNGKSLPGMRKYGAIQAARFRVPFIDRTVEIDDD
jgi:hypothetical protein